MKTKSEIGQQIKAVQKCNRALDRAAGLWNNGRKGSAKKLRRFKRHWKQAYAIRYKNHLTLVDLGQLPSENVPHSEPNY